MFNLFGPRTISPLKVFSEVGDYADSLDGKLFRVRGVLYPKSNKKNRSDYLLRLTEQDAKKEGVDQQRISLQISAVGDEVELVDQWVGWEVVLEGRLSFKVWVDSGTIKISLRKPTIVKAIQVVEIDTDADLEEVIELFNKNPLNKPRGEQVIDYLSNLIKHRKVNVLLLGPRGKGVDDICAEYRRAKGLDQYVTLIRKYRALSPSSIQSEQIKEHFLKLRQELNEYSNSGQYDLICIARGGGDPVQLATINNKDLCKGIINCKVPVCASVAHATDNLWLKQCSDLFTNVPAVFVGELKRAVDKIYPGKVEFRATQQDSDFQEGPRSPRETRLILFIVLVVIAAVAFFVWKVFF